MINENELKEMFAREYGYDSSELSYYFSPGRVNLIGEHIDYNGGMVFPASLSVGVYGILNKRSDNIIRLRSLNADKEIIIDLDKEIVNDPKDDWGNYPKGVIKYLISEGTIIRGCDILYFSDLPAGAGLSSSAALEVLTGYMMLEESGSTNIDRVKLSLLCQSVENNFINVNCGIMDQFSVAMGKKDNAILLDCESIGYEYIPFKLKNYRLVIMNTNKKRELADSKYNERRSSCYAKKTKQGKHRSQVLVLLCILYSKTSFFYNYQEFSA